MTVSEVELREPQQTQTGRKSVITPLILIGFSVFYFLDVCLRASEKFFWYDEILTVYFSRLPNLHSLWNALGTGIDNNPPGFHLLMRGIETVFGDGLIITRLPEILGFWIFCLCLFRFVNRRAGPIAGFTAMAFPMLTGAYFYAYEARPHAMLMGLSGLALMCWEMAVKQPNRVRWLTGFGLSFFAAFMIHCYALVLVIPFAMAEIFRAIQMRRIWWGFWLALIAPAIPACLLYVPLLRAYSSVFKGTTFTLIFHPAWSQVSNFFLFLFSPFCWLVVVMFLLFASHRLTSFAKRELASAEISGIPAYEILLAAGFTALPLFGVILGKLVHGPFFARYFLSALMGICILLGISAGVRSTRNWLAVSFAILVALTLSQGFLRLLWHRYHGWGEPLMEPSTMTRMETTPGRPLELQPLLDSRVRPGLPMLVLSPLDFLYLVQYAPAMAQVRYGALVENDFSYRQFENFRPWSPIRYNLPVTCLGFLKSHPDLLVYGPEGYLPIFTNVTKSEVEMKSLTFFEDHFLAEVKLKPSGTGTP